MQQTCVGGGQGNAYRNELCPICQNSASPYFRKDDYDIDRCPACDFVFVRDIPSEQALAEFYGGYYGESETYVPLTKRRFSKRISKTVENWWHARNIVRHAKGRRRLLEVGCGEGHLLKALARTGKFEVEGIDYGRGAIEYLRSQGLNVAQDSIFGRRYPDGRFDFVVGFHVLEHVQHLGQFVAEVRRVLARHGRVYFVVPCVSHYSARRAGFGWKHYGPPGHLWYFSVAAMRQFMTAEGFRVIFAHCVSNRPHLTVLAEKV